MNGKIFGVPLAIVIVIIMQWIPVVIFGTLILSRVSSTNTLLKSREIQTNIEKTIANHSEAVTLVVPATPSATAKVTLKPSVGPTGVTGSTGATGVK